MSITEYKISTDLHQIDIALVHEFLSNSYWAKDRPVEVVRKSLENSLCFGVYLEGAQIAFARLITDYTVFAYLADVFVLPGHRGKSVSVELMQAILNHPDIAGIDIIVLATKDAHGLYRKYGFRCMDDPDKFMGAFCHEIENAAL